MRTRRDHQPSPLLASVVIWAAVGGFGCTPERYRADADRVARDILVEKQREAMGRVEPFTIERPRDTLRRQLLAGQNLPYSHPASFGSDRLDKPEHWPEEGYPNSEPPALLGESPMPPWRTDEPVALSLLEALQVGARNSREYQSNKEAVFLAALELDLEREEFRHTFAGTLATLFDFDRSSGDSVSSAAHSADLSVSRRLKTGGDFTARLGFDLAQLLTQDGASSLGAFADATINIPLLAGSGRHVVTEPLTQAERDVVYAIWAFERFKRSFAVSVASSYLDVLQQFDRVENTAENYRNLIASARRARRLADAGRLPQIQVDQALQDELRARNSWINAQETYRRQLDGFKITLGLPTDAEIALDRGELERLAKTTRQMLRGEDALPRRDPNAEVLPADAKIELETPTREGGGPLELAPDEAVGIALTHRLDLRTAHGDVYDRQRQVAVEASFLQARLDVTAGGSMGARRGVGSATADDAELSPKRGEFSAGADLELPWNNQRDRNDYRIALINLERAVRDAQQLEDRVKLDIRNALRNLREARESYRIQIVAVQLARRRVASTEMFLDAGRAEIRDLLEARESLLGAQNAATAALVSYRVAELELQRDMGVLQMNEKGLWEEFEPPVADANPPVEEPG